MDTLSRGLIAADKVLDIDYKNFKRGRYSSFEDDKGKLYKDGLLSLEELSELCSEEE